MAVAVAGRMYSSRYNCIPLLVWPHKSAAVANGRTSHVRFHRCWSTPKVLTVELQVRSASEAVVRARRQHDFAAAVPLAAFDWPRPACCTAQIPLKILEHTQTNASRVCPEGHSSKGRIPTGLQVRTAVLHKAKRLSHHRSVHGGSEQAPREHCFTRCAGDEQAARLHCFKRLAPHGTRQARLHSRT